MTVIAAIARDGNVIMGSDSVASCAGSFVYKGEGKIVEIVAAGGDRVLIAAAGNAAVPSVIKRHLKIDGVPALDDSDEAADDWAAAIAQAITELLAGCTPSLIVSSPDDADAIDGTIALAWRGHLWMMCTHTAIRPSNGILSIGSGMDVAVGAMNAALQFGAMPLDAVITAVKLACEFTDSCSTDHRGALIHHTDFRQKGKR